MLDIVEYVTIQSSKLSQLYILGLPKYNTRLSLCSILCDLKEILNVYAMFTPVYTCTLQIAQQEIAANVHPVDGNTV